MTKEVLIERLCALVPKHEEEEGEGVGGCNHGTGGGGAGGAAPTAAVNGEAATFRRRQLLRRLRERLRVPHGGGSRDCYSGRLLRLSSAIADTPRMAGKTIPIPAVRALQKLGRDLALARRKRRLSTADMAARLFVSRDTLWRLERGDPTVAIGTLATAAFILQCHERLADLAAPATDLVGLQQEEARLPQRIRRIPRRA